MEVKGRPLRVCLYKGCTGRHSDVTLREVGVGVLTDPSRLIVNTSGAPLRTIRAAEVVDKKATRRTKCSLELLQDPVTENTVSNSQYPGVGHMILWFR